MGFECKFKKLEKKSKSYPKIKKNFLGAYICFTLPFSCYNLSFLKNRIPTRNHLHVQYRLTLDCPGFSPHRNAIRTDIKANKLIVTGHDEDKLSPDHYSLHDFKKTFTLPEGALPDQLVSFMPMPGILEMLMI